ncbi:hypothetical protein M9Y10_025573 [Tritrichomonas musculus]|uniref:Uncharacterized protein n=1 Tax=Tritrichomonas musculus TaxID=1915356 RepID=A0ABR2HAD7_9EUKA
MKEAQEGIRKIAEKICKREMFIDFSGESGEESTLSNLVDYYINELYKEQQSLELIPISNDLFNSPNETIYSFYFSTVLLFSLSQLNNPIIVDYEDFLSKEILIPTASKGSFGSLLNYAAKCFSSLFQSNNMLFLRSLKATISSNANFSGFVLNQISFPPFKSKDDVKDIATLLIQTNNASPELTSKIIESFLKTDPSNIPSKINSDQDNNFKSLIDFSFSIIKKDKDHESISEMLKNRVYIVSIIKILEKHFTISTEESLIPDFISYLNFLKENRNYQTDLTSQLLSNINPSNINQAYEIIRLVCRYNIFHLNSPNLNDNITYLKKMTDYCIENIVVDDSNATTQFVNFLNSETQEVHIYPYHKIERLCFYLQFKSNPEIRLNSFDLLFKESQLFEKENSDWKDYEFSSQPLYRQFCSEVTSYTRKNADIQMDIHDFIERSNLYRQTIKYVLRRFSNNRPEFAVKVLKDCIALSESNPSMVTLLFAVLTPYLLRQKCCKKVDISHRLFYRFARNNVEALSQLEPTFLIEYLQFVADNEIELFLQLTKSGKANIKSIQTIQLQEEIDVLCRFDKTPKVSLVAQSLLNIVPQLEAVIAKDKSIKLTGLTKYALNYLSVNSLTSSLNPVVTEAFLSYSNFLTDNEIDYEVKFIQNCDDEFFEKVYSKYPNKKDDIIFEALHFIPSIVTRYFLNHKTKNESASSVRPEITGYLLSNKSNELDELFQSKYPNVKHVNDKNVIATLNEQQKKVVLYSFLQFFRTPFVEEIGERAYATIYLLKDTNPISQLRISELNSLYHFLFKNPQVSPKDLFFTSEDESYKFFKSLVEYGASDQIVSDLLKKCPHSKTVSERFLTDEWDYIEKSGNEQVNEDTIKAFRAVVSNEKVRGKLSKSENLGAFRVYLKNAISKAIEEEKVDIDFFASILSNDNRKLDYYRVVELLITEMTEAISNEPSEFNSPELTTFFEICVIVAHLSDEGISRSIFSFINLVLNTDTIRSKLFDKDFVSNIVKISMIDDSFLSIITENKMKTKISEFINSSDDKDVRFWHNMILRKLDQIKNEDFDFIISNVSKALEFNSIEMKQRCLMILSIVMPDRDSLSEAVKEKIKKFVEYLILSPNVDPRYSHHILLFIDEALGPIDVDLTDVDIDAYRNSVDDVREYFTSLRNDE